jgi:hypothetical protein
MSSARSLLYSDETHVAEFFLKKYFLLEGRKKIRDITLSCYQINLPLVHHF